MNQQHYEDLEVEDMAPELCGKPAYCCELSRAEPEPCALDAGHDGECRP